MASASASSYPLDTAPAGVEAGDQAKPSEATVLVPFVYRDADVSYAKAAGATTIQPGTVLTARLSVGSVWIGSAPVAVKDDGALVSEYGIGLSRGTGGGPGTSFTMTLANGEEIVATVVGTVPSTP